MCVHVDESRREDPFPILAVNDTDFDIRKVVLAISAGGDGVYVSGLNGNVRLIPWRASTVNDGCISKDYAFSM